MPEPGFGLHVDAELGIAFVGTYVPRRCGIATFTRDLAEATSSASKIVSPMILAMTDPGGEYEYPTAVRYEIRQGVRGDYARAAEFVNYSSVRLVSIQHEFGIFGGDDGVYLLDFLTQLHVPAIATLHTVLRNPTDSQKAIVRHIAKCCARVVVMSSIAKDLLATAHGVAGPKVQIIPHGIPTMEPRDQERLKGKFGVAGKRMLLTFGLLSPAKGIETVIRALPSVVAEFPDTRYFVVGATHPVIKKGHGEAYRTSLEQEAQQLGVREHVVFRDQFVTSEELASYLQAADIFVSPYLNEAQVTSGALSYAMGAGAAVVSTPYWHAQELLADGRGSLFPFQDSNALGRALRELLGSREKLKRMRAAAFEFTRPMVWPQVGKAYFDLGTSVLADRKARLEMSSVPKDSAPRLSSLPDLRLDHMQRMTDDTGIIQHATFSVPARRSGYCVDDNARALIVALQADRVQQSPETRRLVTTYLSYLLCSQEEDGHFRNFMRYNRVLEDGPRSDDCIGRAVWALGVTVQLAADDGSRLLARDMFERAIQACGELGLRGTALAAIGASSVLSAEPGHQSARRMLALLAKKLVDRYQAEATEDWRWFERTLTYDNAMIPLALFTAYRVTGERSALRIARESLEFLEGVCFIGDRLSLVGSTGWHSRGGKKAAADEQAIDAAAFVLAFRSAYLATNDHHYLERMRQAFGWFLGANRLGVSLYDFATAGCRDGLGVSQANENQGAESTLSFLLALLGVLELASESVDYTAAPSGAESGTI